MRSHSRSVGAVVLALGLGSSALLAQRGAAPPAAAVAPANAPAGEWRHYAADNGSTKYSPLDRINPGNVSKLAIAWRWTSPDNAIAKATPAARPGSYQDTPIYANGVLYTETSLGIFVALNPATGQELWRYDPESWKIGRPPNLGYTHRGLAYWTDGKAERLFSGTHDAYIVSLDAKTGKPDPAFGTNGRVDASQYVALADRMKNYAINSAPVIVKNVIIVGSNIPDNAFSREAPRGDITGYDVRTGKRLWTFRSIPQPGEFGHETWEGNSSEYTGNTNVWSMMSVDEELGYAYLPFGTPTNDYYGADRPGGNLFAESLVCLDVTTGKRVWHFQGVHHGLWDYDFPAPPILGDITVDGKRIKAAIQVSKQGWVYVFDRKTGQPVWPIEERPVAPSTMDGEKAAKTQPFVMKPPAFEQQGFTEKDVIDFTPELHAAALEVLKKFDYGPLFTPPTERGSIQAPGNVGGANWGGAAFDPTTGMLFVPSINHPIVVQLVKGDPARGNLKFRRGGVQNVPTVDGLRIWKPPYSSVTAYDLNKGTIAWRVPLGDGPRNHPLLKDLNLPKLGSMMRGAAMVTGSLVFVNEIGAGLGIGDAVPVAGRPLSPRLEPEPPMLRAFDKTNGTLVWETALPQRPAASPMTFLHQGKQYIAMAIGSGTDAEVVAYAVP